MSEELSQKLGIVITTSPIKSNPSTEVIDLAIDSIRKQKHLENVKIYIVCDGVKLNKDPNSYKFKAGDINDEQNKNYNGYKKNLKKKYNDKKLYEIIEKNVRCGFAGNVYTTILKIPEPYVMIYQHDFLLVRDIDFKSVIDAFETHSDINYVGFYSKSVSKLPLSLLVKQNITDIFGKSKEDMLQKYYKKFGLPLVPLNFWYDRVHIARKEYYLKEVYKQHYLEINPNFIKKYKTKNFIEDTFGQYMKESITMNINRIDEFGAFIFWDAEEIAVIHLNG